jgi:hypothetical protein
MNEFNIFPITLFDTYLEVPNELIEGIKEEIKNEPEKYTSPKSWDGGAFSSFNHNSDLLYGTPYVNEIIEHVTTIVQSHPFYIKTYNFGEKFRYDYEIWWNYYKAGKYQEYHSHGNDLISGIWYLSDSTSNTVFCKEGRKHKIPSVKGRLLFFPSTLSHYVEPADTERMTVSFNFQISKRNL